MHQVFYIDIDEEITSVIDRLKKSKGNDNFFVVPKRALILQSIVNLKLFKKEAEKNNKQVVIVTQDEQGRMAAEKAGIVVRSSAENLEDSQEVREDPRPNLTIKSSENYIRSEKLSKKDRLEKLGTESFFTKAGGQQKEVRIAVRKPDDGSIINKELVRKTEGKKMESVFPLSSGNKVVPKVAFPEKNQPKEYYQEKSQEIFNYKNNLDSHKENVLKKIFDSKDDNNRDNKKVAMPVSNRLKKVFVFFLLFCLLAVSGIAAYLFVPKAKISVYLESGTKGADMEVKAGSNVAGNQGDSVIPARIIEKEDSLVMSYDATGKKSSSTQKARGTIVIYNEYSASEQPLVATTRFASADGKIFRLVKGVVVPGMAKIGDNNQPGVIEAEVIADEAGEEFNIGPSRFAIPGFQGSTKYEKFYASSTKPMSGGGSNGDAIRIVSQGNIDSAKKATEEELLKKVIVQLKGEIEAGEVVLDEAVSKDVLESYSLSKADSIADNFDYAAKIKIKAVVFQENDLKKLVSDKLREQGVEKGNINPDLVRIEYGQPTVDFKAGIVNMKLYGKIAVEPEIDLEKLKKELLGKNMDQTKEILQKYPQIKKVEVDFWPKFVPEKIPAYDKRVEMEHRYINPEN